AQARATVVVRHHLDVPGMHATSQPRSGGLRTEPGGFTPGQRLGARPWIGEGNPPPENRSGNGQVVLQTPSARLRPGWEELPAEQSALDLPGGRVFWVVFEALAFEVLHRETGGRVAKLFADRVAVDGKAAIGLPEVAEAEAEAMAGWRVEGAVGVVTRRDRLERCRAGQMLLLRQFNAEQAELDVEALRPGAWVPFEARAFEVLRHEAGARVGIFLGDRIAENRQPAVLVPVGE